MANVEKKRSAESKKKRRVQEGCEEFPFQNERKTLNENLKKALTEFLVLNLLNIDKMPVCQILTELAAYSDGTIDLAFPYPILYRLLDKGYIVDMGKSKTFDGRRRQVFMISEAGREYLDALKKEYICFVGGANSILEKSESTNRI